MNSSNDEELERIKKKIVKTQSRLDINWTGAFWSLWFTYRRKRFLFIACR